MGSIVTDNPGAERFELHVDGEFVGWAEYRDDGESLIITHVEIDERRQNKGLGGVLVDGAVRQIAERGRTVVPLCPFAAEYVRRRPEFAEAIAPRVRHRFPPAR
jgi:uncharacterized protein